MNKYHEPVMLNESIDALNVVHNGVYVDATFGGGGHSKKILEKLKRGKLYAFDKDIDSNKNHLKDDRFKLFISDYKYISEYLKIEKVLKIDGLIADLGISSYQIDNKERGFSYNKEYKLDMRMNQKSKFSAVDLVNSYSVDELNRVFKKYGDFKNPSKITSKILDFRKKNKIRTTVQLAKVITENQNHDSTNLNKFLSRVFQAIRIEVNDELNALKSLLISSTSMLKKSARLVIISYHSAEDRIVKNWFKKGDFEGNLKKDFYGNKESKLKEINKKVITPHLDEIKNNSRSRSAKMRVAFKI
tara:strand:+ start:486 stop:1391 length:906 start_codon:yes stop_codon:yes gene_type:complete